MPGFVSDDPRFRISPTQAREIADRFGTPLYVIGEAHFRARIRRYRAAFEATWPKAEIAYASKANSTLAVLAIAHQEGCVIDVASEGELRAALAAGVPASRCHLHGNYKSRREIQVALELGVGRVVADNFGELDLLAEHIQGSSGTKIVLRLAPGVDPITHHKISTGQADTKFGFNIGDGSAEKATVRALELGLPVSGFHCHVGSQLLDPEAQQSGAELIAQFAADMKRKHGFEAAYLNVGGGLGVTYTEGDVPTPVELYCAAISASVAAGLGDSGLDVTLGQEPGRSLIGESGVTLYRVGPVKTVPSPSRGLRTYVAVDGGLADNPRPALYGAKYELDVVNTNPGDEGNIVATVSGRHCETDMLFEDIQIPARTGPGDLMQVLCTGAYNSSMASNYNRYARPATVLIRENGESVLVQRPETWDEMFARESLPKDLNS